MITEHLKKSRDTIPQRPLPLNGAVRRVDGSRRFFSFFTVCTYSYYPTLKFNQIPLLPSSSLSPPAYTGPLALLLPCCPSHTILDLSTPRDYFLLLTICLPISLWVPKPEELCHSSCTKGFFVCWSWVILQPLRVGNSAGSTHTISYGCALSQFAGLLAEEGNSRPGGAASVTALFGSSSLPLPFLCLCFPFVSFFF